MRVLEVRNVQQALPVAMDLLESCGVAERNERTGSVCLVAPWPVTTVYEKPTERVLFHPWRDANPFFHLYESLWMLAGRSDVSSLTRFVQRMGEFSDDGSSFNAAYGHRWRRHFMGDQLAEIGARLRRDPSDRRCVLQVWDSGADFWRYDENIGVLPYSGRDAACNVTATFQVRAGRLDMEVLCRSNDILWGCYGANAVHFSVLLEYVAARVGVPVGTYRQISVNWHAYEAEWNRVQRRRAQFFDQWAKNMQGAVGATQSGGAISDGLSVTATYDYLPPPVPLVSIDPDEWDQECTVFASYGGRAPDHCLFRDKFLRTVALPIVRAHDAYKRQDHAAAFSAIAYCESADWRLACHEWLARRVPPQAKEAAQ